MEQDAQTLAAQQLRRQTQEHALEALEVILSIMNDPQAGNGDRMKAANLILERACGKAGGAPAGAHGGAGDKRDRLEDIRAELKKIQAGGEERGA